MGVSLVGTAEMNEGSRISVWRKALAPASRVVIVIALTAQFLPILGSTNAEAAVPIEDINPDVSDLDPTDANGSAGGRVNGVASDASDNKVFYAATEWGGLRKTVDGGLKWKFLKQHLPMATWDVKVDPSDPETVYATSFYDGRINSVAGINVSQDGGDTWTHPASSVPPAPFECFDNVRKEEPSAFGIAVRSDAPSNVAIGTNCGLAISTDSGTTWTFRDPIDGDGGTGADIIWDVVWQGSGGTGNGIIDICGEDGHFRSTDGGSNWMAGTGLPSGICSIAASPDETTVLFVAASDNFIYETDDANNWTNLGSPDPTNQGRIPFVAVNDRTGTAFDLWFGDVRLYRGACTSGAAQRCPNAPGPGWNGPYTRTAGAHDDVGDIVFDTQPPAGTDACPRLFSSDGGMYRNTNITDPGCQVPSWEQANVGLHAHWLFSMAGADQPGNDDEDLYYGLQDSGSFATTQAGKESFDPADWSNKDCCDVFDTVADSNRVVYTVCCGGHPSGRTGTGMYVRNAGMTGGGEVNTYPPGANRGFRPMDAIAQFGPTHYAVVTNAGVFFTNDITVNPIVWTALGGAPPAGACAISAAVPTATPNNPTFYVQAGSVPSGSCNERNQALNADQLWKVTGTAAGAWTRIDNNLTDGGIGIFGVDPKDPNHIIASNIRTGSQDPQMVVSKDGGSIWVNDPELDNLMIGGGVFKYRTAAGPSNFTQFQGYPQPTFVAFDPENPNLIAAGGRDSGVFFSTDDGNNWGVVTDPVTSGTSGVPHLPRPWFAYFDHEVGTKVYIGTQGRGVWRLSIPSADVTISKTDSPDPATPGEGVTYTVNVTNDGPGGAENVKVIDKLPEEATFTSATPAVCVEAPTDTLSCDLGDIPNGTTSELKINVTLDGDTVTSSTERPKLVTNTVEVVTSGSIDPDLTNNAASVTTTVNSAPQANDDPGTTSEDTPVVINVLANDTDADGDPLTVSAVTDPPHGTAVIDLPDKKTITYTPDPNFCGVDQFGYTATDGTASDSAIVVPVNVTCNNDPPVANADTPTTAEDTPLGIEVLANDTDPDSGDVLSVISVTDPANGTTQIESSGFVTYSPDANVCGPDTFNYTISDGNGSTAIGTVNVTVTCVNDAPVISPIPNRISPWGEDVTQTVTATDPDGNPLTYSLVSGPPGATVSPSGTFSWTPSSTQVGLHTIVVRATDGTLSDDETFTVTVNKRSTNIVNLVGPSGQYSDPVAVTAELRDFDGNPVSGRTLSFAIGSRSTTAATDLAGSANGSIVLADPAGPYSVAIGFAGDAAYSAFSTSSLFTIEKELVNATFTGTHLTITTGTSAPTTLKATVAEEPDGNLGNGIATLQVKFTDTAGALLCSSAVSLTNPGQGTASCTTSSLALGSRAVVVSVTGASYKGPVDVGVFTIAQTPTGSAAGAGRINTDDFGFMARPGARKAPPIGDAIHVFRQGAFAYVLKSTSLTSLSRSCSGGKDKVCAATIEASGATKIAIELATGIVTTPVEGPSQLKVDATDVAEPGGSTVPPDTYAVNITGATTYSLGTSALQLLINAGNIRIPF